jgi:hypothetical protein
MDLGLTALGVCLAVALQAAVIGADGLETGKPAVTTVWLPDSAVRESR